MTATLPPAAPQPLDHRVARLCVGPETPLSTLLVVQERAPSRGLPGGIVLVVDDEGRLLGTVTDGDVRRALMAEGRLDLSAREVMRPDPITFPAGTSMSDLLMLLPAELGRRGRRSQRFLGKIVLVDESRRPERVLDYHQLWEQRVATHRHVVVLGTGYVGLTLALVLADVGFAVTGYDVDEDRVAALCAGRSHVHEVGIDELLMSNLDDRLVFSSAIPDDGDVFVIAVGTPVVRELGRSVPDLCDLERAAAAVAAHLTPGALVVLRSTVPIGTTRQVVMPILERGSGLAAGSDFHLAFAPERTSEGAALHELRSLPQLIGGIDTDSTEAAAALFRELTPTLVRMESPEAAELAKLVNNSFRDLVFAFSNEVAQLAAPFDFDVVEAIRAANRGYPRDPVPLPSPGVGGPCLTKDPYILASVGARSGATSTLSEAGRSVNESMESFVVDSVLRHVDLHRPSREEVTVLACGLAFKGHPETGDVRSSTGVSIARRLAAHVGRVLAHDPVASAEDLADVGLEACSFEEAVPVADVVLFLNNHDHYRRLDIVNVVRRMRSPALVFDGWHLFHPEDALRGGPAVYMGLGFSRSSAGTKVLHLGFAR